MVLVLLFFGWYLFLRNPNIPAGETIRGILPFGSGEDISELTTDPSNPFGASDQAVAETIDEFGIPAAGLSRISNSPVAGFVLLDKNKQTVARYVDRATGHIYDVYLATKASSTSFEKVKVTNNTLPKIYEAYFRSDGNAVILRYLKEDSDIAENLSLTLTLPRATSTSSPQTNTLYTVSSTPIRGDIGSLAVGSGNTIFSVLRDSSSIVSSTFNGTGAKTLFSSAFNNWHLATAGSNLIVFTKASMSAPGYAYNLNLSNGTLTKILGPLNGLVIIPSTFSNQILYSYVENGRTRLFAKNSQNNIPLEISPETLAGKCVWSSAKAGILFCGVPIDGLASGEPDNWYRGITHFSDRIWMFNANTDIAQVMVEPEQALGTSLDVFEPRLSSNEDFLVFINKIDLSLWALKLEKF